MSAELTDFLLFAVALVAVLGCVYYYVQGVLHQDRLLSRASAVASVIFGVLAVVFLVRLV
jgi:hypothetical protein